MTSPHRFPLNYVVAALAAGLSLATSSAFSQSTDNSVGLEQMTITAEKRLTVLDKTPDAISAIKGTRLIEMGATGLEDVVTLVPNASFVSSYGAAKINIRGIGLNSAIGSPGVATYVDGAYVSDLTSSNSGMFDLQRVEVLRGPQGALYGRNATGGAVNYVTARPTQETQGQASLLLGNYGRQETEGFVSGALSDGTTSARLSWQVKSRDGFTQNSVAGNEYGPVIPGQTGTVGPKYLDDLNTKSFRFQTLTDLGNAGTFRLIVGSHKENDVGPYIAILPQDVQTSKALFGVSPSLGRYMSASNGQSYKVDVQNSQAIYERSLGDNTLTASLSYRKSKSALFVDGDATAALVASTNLVNESTDKGFDVHVASPDNNRLQWLIGANYIDFDAKSDSYFQQKLSLGILTGIAARNPFPVPNYLTLGGTARMQSTAGYGDVRYAITPSLAVRGGLRINKEDLIVNEYQTNSAVNGGASRTASPSASWNSTPGNIGLEWNMDKETMFYGKLSKGFKSGAINMGILQTTPVKPETVVSTELGMKSSFLNNRGAFSAALFNSDYKDMQFSQITSLSSALINAPGAKISGLELELLFKPITSLTLGANVGLMDPRFSNFTNANSRNPLAGQINLNGNQITNVSKTQASLSADYSQVIDSYKTTFRADYVWRDKFYFTEFNDADTMQKAYGMLNLAASVRPSGSKWKFFAQIRNATNTQAYTSMTVAGTPNAGHRSVTFTAPRTLGLGMSLDF